MMLKIVAEIFIKPDYVVTVTPLFQELVKKNRQEPECISYDLFIDQNQPGHFVFIETWPNQVALDKHCQTEHFRRLVPQINAYQRKDFIVTLLDSFE